MHIQIWLMYNKESDMIDMDLNKNSKSGIGNKEPIIIMEISNSINSNFSEHFSEEK